MIRRRIFCLPYAGAGSSIYSKWQKYFGNDIEICPIELPGRERKIREPLIDNIEEMARTVYDGIKMKLNEPFCIFGHSMGGMIAYELTRHIKKYENKSPEYLFMSASGLKIKKDNVLIHKLSDKELIEHVIKNGGTQRVFAENKAFAKYFLPIIRNDYKAVETYKPSIEKLNCKIRAFASREDTEINYKETQKLANYTDDFDLKIFKGNHFFIRDNEEEVCNEILNIVSKN